MRPRAVHLAYTWGSGPSSCSPYFVRSWVALPESERANTDLRILWEGSVPPCANEPAGGGAEYVAMPPDVLRRLKATKLNPAAYRMRAFTWWLSTPGECSGKTRTPQTLHPPRPGAYENPAFASLASAQRLLRSGTDTSASSTLT